MTVLLAAIVALVLVLAPGSRHAPLDCVYAGPSRAALAQYERRVGTDVRCAMVFDDAATTWQQWAAPWFTTTASSSSDLDWSSYARAGNRLVITLNLFPSDVNDTDWRPAGAQGAYAGYARLLARNLVRSGMGDAIIRLGHEANGTWYPDNVGDTATSEAQWRQFWRRTVLAMRSVAGAHFSFDWCVNAGVRPISLAAYYPGDDVVDSIGVDVYDVGVPAGVTDRWNWIYDRPEGVGAVVRFARAHHKPLAIPEWGLETASHGGAGADPAYTRGIAGVLAHNDASFESYFFLAAPEQALLDDPASMRVYRDRILRSSAVN